MKLFLSGPGNGATVKVVTRTRPGRSSLPGECDFDDGMDALDACAPVQGALRYDDAAARA